MRIFIYIFLFLNISCASAGQFLIGAGGNIFSDSIGREIEKKTNPDSDCKKWNE